VFNSIIFSYLITILFGQICSRLGVTQVTFLLPVMTEFERAWS